MMLRFLLDRSTQKVQHRIEAAQPEVAVQRPIAPIMAGSNVEGHIVDRTLIRRFVQADPFHLGKRGGIVVRNQDPSGHRFSQGIGAVGGIVGDEILLFQRSEAFRRHGLGRNGPGPFKGQRFRIEVIGILNRREMQHNFSEYFVAVSVDGIVTIGNLSAIGGARDISLQDG